MNLRNIANKIVGVGLAVLTVDCWRIAKIEQNRAKANDTLKSEIDRLNKSNFEKDMSDIAIKNKIEGTTGRIQESQSEIERLTPKSSSIIDQINKGGSDSQTKEQLLNNLSRVEI